MSEELEVGKSVRLQPARFSRVRGILRLVAWCGVAVVVGLCIQSARSMLLATAYRDSMPEATAHAMGLITPTPKQLVREFTDTQGRLLADPPASASDFLDPATLVVAHINSDDSEAPSIPWDAFEKHLAQVTGKQVEDAPFETKPEELEQIKAGKYTVVALHAAETPFMVNDYGYQPIAAFGDDGGINGNHVDIIVPASSPITKPAELNGKSLVCTVPGSITGYRAAVAMMMKDEHFRPNVDYTITWSLGQKKSIHGIVKKTFPAAAVSDDKLQAMVRAGKIQASDFRTIYTSEVIPRTTIGYFYNLKPELAEKVRQAILTSKPGAKSADDTDSGSPTQHFIAIDYKKDFAFVRLIDDSFDPRLGGKAPKASRASAVAAASDPTTAATLPATVP